MFGSYPILGSTHAALGKFDDALRYVADAMNSIKTNKEKWFEAEVNRVAGEIALSRPRHIQQKPKHILIVHSRSHATASKILGTPRRDEPRTPLARPGQGAASARTLAPVYGWFTEGFDTRDLKEAKVLLEELAA